MHPPDGCAPIGTCGDYFRAHAGVERAACALIGQAKANRGHVHRVARFVADHDSDAARSSRAYTIADTFAFHHSQLQRLRARWPTERMPGRSRQWRATIL